MFSFLFKKVEISLNPTLKKGKLREEKTNTNPFSNCRQAYFIWAQNYCANDFLEN